MLYKLMILILFASRIIGFSLCPSIYEIKLIKTVTVKRQLSVKISFVICNSCCYSSSDKVNYILLSGPIDMSIQIFFKKKERSYQ